MKLSQFFPSFFTKKARTPDEIAVDAFAKNLADTIKKDPRAVRRVKIDPQNSATKAAHAIGSDTIRLLRIPTSQAPE
jgi:hypothetical protein